MTRKVHRTRDSIAFVLSRPTSGWPINHPQGAVGERLAVAWNAGQVARLVPATLFDIFNGIVIQSRIVRLNYFYLMGLAFSVDPG